MFNVLFIPYRDIYFWQNYGSAVRDLQFLEIFSNLPQVNSLTVVNRPVSIYERFLNKRKKNITYLGINIIDTTSFDLIGPLKKRAWTVSCYKKIISDYIDNYLMQENNEIPLLVIDFTPLAIMPIVKNERIIYWYDMIDNFTKHNCYTEAEKKLVDTKYQYVAKNYNFLTSVTEVAGEAIRKYNDINAFVVTNGVFTSQFTNKKLPLQLNEAKYDFGFVGFITDKFDVKFVRELAKKYSIVVYGEAYNNEIVEQLSSAGITVLGKFSYSQLPQLIASFRVGLLPYLTEKSHDGSPLKMYEYLKNNKPCITSIDYEFSCEYVVNYNTAKEFSADIERLINCSGSAEIYDVLPNDSFLHNKLTAAFSFMEKRIS